jgi:hypothetical protein
MKKYIPYIVIVMLAISLLLSARQCSIATSTANTNYNTLTDTVNHFKNRIGTITASKATLQLNNAQLQGIILNKDNALAALAKEFAEVKSVVKFQAVTKFDTIQIAYKDSIPCVFERSGTISDKWYSFGYKADQAGVTIDSFKTWISASVVTGTKRKWFLGEQTIKTDITLSNPNMIVADITTAEVVVPSPWYRKWYMWLAVGAVGGFVMAK